MAITHSTATRNAMANAIDDQANSGVANPNAQLVLMAAGDVEVATLEMSNPAFGAASNGTITANAITADPSATGGTVVAFKVVDRDGAEVYRGSVATSGADLNMTSTTIAATEQVSVSSLAYTAPN